MQKSSIASILPRFVEQDNLGMICVFLLLQPTLNLLLNVGIKIYSLNRSEQVEKIAWEMLMSFATVTSAVAKQSFL